MKKENEIFDHWYESVNQASDVSRTAMLFLLIVALYLLIMVSQTDDMILLREETVELPLMQIGIPVVVFYAIAPLIFMLLHVNLLLRLSQLATAVVKLRDLTSSTMVDSRISKSFAFDYSYMLLGTKSFEIKRLVMCLVFFLQVGVVPVTVLFFLQMHFLAYQDEGITFFHQFVTTLDLLFLATFAYSFVTKWSGVRPLDRKGKGRAVSAIMLTAAILKRSVPFVPIALVAFFSWFILLVPDGYIEKKVNYPWQQEISGWIFTDWWKEPDVESELPLAEGEGAWFSGLKNFLTDKPLGEVRRYIDLSHATISLRDVSPFIVGALIQQDNDATPKIPCEHIGKLKLEDRRLHYARFVGSKFECTELKNALMSGADLSGAHFIGAEMTGTDFSDANLSGADFAGSNLSGSEFRNANLRNAYLHGTNLSYAYFSRADLRHARLRRVDLRGAHLHGAKLSDAEFHHADLSDAQLHSADLSRATLFGANLRNAKLHGTNLHEANLNGANLLRAELHGANLSWSKLHGANLTEAELHGADMAWAELYGAYMAWAELHGANLFKAQLHGADLTGVELHGANLRLAKLRGASLVYAELHGADLFRTELHGSVLIDTELHGAALTMVSLEHTDLRGALLGKPEDEEWDAVLSNIKNGYELRGLFGKVIEEKLSGIEQVSGSDRGIFLSSSSTAGDCILHDNTWAYWKASSCTEEEVGEIVAQNVVRVACSNRSVAEMVMYAVETRPYALALLGALTQAADTDKCTALQPFHARLDGLEKLFARRALEK